MRILGMTMMTVLLIGGLALATTVNLTDGRVVQGDVIKKDSKSLQISVDGITMTYYADEIKDIDGQPFASDQSAPAPASAPTMPAAQPESAAQPEPEAPMASADGIDADKRALILKFIDVFGTRQALNHNFEMMINQIEKDKPQEAEKIRQRVNIDEIIERLLPLYDRHFSAEDLKAYITFYGSDEGRKLISTIPVLMKESVQESIKYMQEKFPEGQGAG